MGKARENHRYWKVMTCALVALLALTALGFAGCGNDGNDKNSGAADPEDVVESFFEALKDQDTGALMELFDADSLEELQDDLGSSYRSDLKDYFFSWMPEDAAFKGLKYDSDIDGKEAEVEVTKARVTFEDDYGDPVSVDIATSDEPITFDLVKGKNGWFLSPDSFSDLGDEDASFSDLFADAGDNYGTGTSTSEEAALEAAMLSYLKAHAQTGLEFVLRNLQVYGDEAVGVYECTNMDLEWPMVYMKKGSGGWYGVNAGTGFDPPSWYDWDWGESSSSPSSSYVTCPLCNGVGTVEGGDGRYICPFCGGSCTVNVVDAAAYDPEDWLP